MTDHKTEIKNRLNDPATVLEKLGLLETARKARDGYKIPCLWHGENDPSCSVRQHPGDGTLSVYCFGCGDGGDVLGLIGQVFGLSLNNQFSEILEIAAGYAGVDLGDKTFAQREPPKRAAPPPPEYPPIDDLRDMWNGCKPPADDPQSREWFGSRRLSTDALEDLCRVIPQEYYLPAWAVFRDDESGRYDWLLSGHRLIFPLYNSEGKIRSFKARGMLNGKIKNVNPLGYSTAGLCFACANAQKMLATRKHFETVLFVEGEVDFLSAVQSLGDNDCAVFGIYSGAVSDDHVKKINCDKIYFLTDNDSAGDAYHNRLFESMRSCGAENGEKLF